MALPWLTLAATWPLDRDRWTDPIARASSSLAPHPIWNHAPPSWRISPTAVSFHPQLDEYSPHHPSSRAAGTGGRASGRIPVEACGHCCTCHRESCIAVTQANTVACPWVDRVTLVLSFAASTWFGSGDRVPNNPHRSWKVAQQSDTLIGQKIGFVLRLIQRYLAHS